LLVALDKGVAMKKYKEKFKEIKKALGIK